MNFELKNTLFVVLSVIVLAASCSEKSADTSNFDKIELVDGVKWEVNKEMMVYIKIMEADILITSKVGEPDYSALGERLSKNTRSLITNCSMSGRAHDELHKWLHPFMETTDKLREATEKERQAELFKDLQGSMTTFNTYFE